MSTLTLELIATSAVGYGQPGYISLQYVNHVHNRVEKFAYYDDIKSAGVALDYVESAEITSRKNLQIANRTYGLAANSPSRIETRSVFGQTANKNVVTEYSDILVTNVVVPDEQGKRKPLFYRHELGDNVVECKLQVVSSGNRHDVDTGYQVDLDAGVVYTNYTNFFDVETGAYKLFFVTCTAQDGSATHSILQPVPVASEADWQDIEDDGRLTEDYPVYVKEKIGTGYSFGMNTRGPWIYRPLARSLIQPFEPSGIEASDPWYMKFSNGDVTARANGSMRRYYVPEFHAQPFAPAKPYVYSPYSTMEYVNPNVIAATRPSLAIDPDAGLHLTLFVSDHDDVLLRVLTTDQSLGGLRYSNTDVFYESDLIQSWDNAGGFIVTGLKLHAGWQYAAQYFYEAKDYEYTLLNLNPVINKEARDRLFVFYLVPDVDTDDRAIHYLMVDRDGVILYTSQDQGFNHPNLQLRNSDDSYNENTVVGLKYSSEVSSNTFLGNYVVGYENTNGYLLLAEVAVLSVNRCDEQIVYDVRTQGAVPVAAQLEAVLQKNPRILQSAAMNREDGQEVPKNKVMIIEAPITLLEDYGGDLTEEQATSYLTQILDVSVYPVVEWTYPWSELSGSSITAAEVDLSWTWEQPSVTYVLYRKANLLDQWTEIYRDVSPAEGAMSYTDTDVTTNDVMHYIVRIIEDGIELPYGNSLSVKVR